MGLVVLLAVDVQLLGTEEDKGIGRIYTPKGWDATQRDLDKLEK